jgi:hypothetical protein
MNTHIEKIESVTDRLTGELLSLTTEVTDINTIPAEPNYLKLYIDDLGLLNKLSGGETRALIHIAALANYDGEMVLPLAIKKRIAESAGVKVATISDTLTKLIGKGIIKRLDATLYVLNPDLFAKGKWRDIREQRKAFQSITTYTPDGKKKTETRIIDDEVKSNSVANDNIINIEQRKTS